MVLGVLPHWTCLLWFKLWCICLTCTALQLCRCLDLIWRSRMWEHECVAPDNVFNVFNTTCLPVRSPCELMNEQNRSLSVSEWTCWWCCTLCSCVDCFVFVLDCLPAHISFSFFFFSHIFFNSFTICVVKTSDFHTVKVYVLLIVHL